jgi:dTMP kinase
MQNHASNGARRENQLVTLFRIPIFRRMWAAITLSSLGDWLGLLANTALAQQLTRDHSLQAQGAAISGVILVRLAPDLLFGPFAAALADKFDRRRIVIIGEVTAAILYASIAVSYQLLWLYIAQFLIEAVGLFTQPAKQAIWISVMPKKLLATGNQLSLVSVYGTVPVAAAIFAVLSSLDRIISGTRTVLPQHTSFAIVVALLFDAVTFLISASTVFLSGHLITARPGDREREQGVLSLLREGVSFLRHNRIISGLYVGIIGAFAAGGLTVGVAQLWVATMSAGNAGYSIMFGTVFTGLAVGMLTGPRVFPKLNRPRVFAIAIGGAGVSLVSASFIRDFILADVFAEAIGLFAGMAWIVGYTLIGEEVEDRLRGRIFAFVQSSVRLTLLFTIAVGPNLAGAIGTHSFKVGDDSRLILSGPGLTLLIGGAVALLVSWFAGARTAVSPRHLRETVGRWLLRSSMSKRVEQVGIFTGEGFIVPAHDSSNGLLVAFEGGEGSGKSTQIARLAETLRAEGIEVIVTHEPGATPVGTQIRELLLHHAEPLGPRAEAMLFAADRAHHVDTVIVPALASGKVVLTDRFMDSSLAYQGVGRGLPLDEVRQLSLWATGGLVPHLTVVLDLPPTEGLSRVAGRGAADKLESESLDFHERVREAYLAQAALEPERYLVLDATDSPDDLAARIAEGVANRRATVNEVVTP